MREAHFPGPYDEAPLGRGARLLEAYKLRRRTIFGGMILAAMLAFELFNFLTTDFALTNLLGDLRFVGVRWAMILAIAFCGMDFAGIARLFTPEAERAERGQRTEVWYLLAAWFLAATMNAVLTWWGVSLALLNHSGLGNEILNREVLLSVVPVFVAMLVWLIRILLIGMLAMAGDRLFTHLEDVVRRADRPASVARPSAQPSAARLPTADWAGAARDPRPVEAGAARPARTIGAAAPPDPYDPPRRSNSLAEQHAQRRNAGTQRPPNPAVRPAPKPSSMARSGGDHNGFHDLD